MYDLDARKFFLYVMRLPAYQGALRATAEREHEQRKGSSSTSSTGSTKTFSDIKHNPELDEYFD